MLSITDTKTFGSHSEDDTILVTVYCSECDFNTYCDTEDIGGKVTVYCDNCGTEEQLYSHAKFEKKRGHSSVEDD